jgi:membrane protease YdiL (CAAX protease family)
MEIASAFFGGLILGALAVRTKSFFYGFVIHWFIALGLDLMVILPYLLHSHT